MNREASILDASPDGVFAVDRALRVTLWNRRMAELTGIARDAIVGTDLFARWPALAGERERLQAALDGKPTSAAFAVPGIEVRYAPYDDGAFAILCVVDAAAEEAEARFRIMADTSPVLLWMSGTDARCTFFNQRWLDFTGRSMELELGSGWAEGVHHEDFQFAMDHYLAAFVARKPFRMEYRLRRADGEYRWLLDTGVPRYTTAGTFAGFIGSCIDITELKDVRDDLDRRVRERTAELEAFAYSVSHDLRAPLRHIDGFCRALAERTPLDETAQHYLDRVINASGRMAELIDDLLQLSRIGRQELRRVRCDVSQLAREAFTSFEQRERTNPIELRVEDGLYAEADPQLVRILFENLLGNAWKFTSPVPHARVDVTGARHENTLEISVRDNGVGFDNANAAKLFAPFHRLHSAEQFPGTGIGLAIAHRIVNRHGGEIRAEATPGAGAVFRFTLP